MKNLHVCISTILLSISSIGFTQTTLLPTEEKPYIEVVGTAEKEVFPDEIYIGITIREKYVNNEKISIESQEVKLKEALQSIGIDMNNLYLSDVNADYVKVYWHKKDVLTKKDYILKVSDATEVSKVFQELEKLDITDANIAKVKHSKIDSLLREVKILAIKAAKAKADYLLTAIGEETGKPLVIKEIETLPLTPANVIEVSGARVGNYEQDINSKYDYQVRFEKIKLQSSIYIKFSIKE
jgi:hypothetical protein